MFLGFLVACAGDEAVDSARTRFLVQSVQPADGDVAVAPLTTVQLSFSDIPDLARCTARSIRVDAARDDGTLAFGVPVEISLAGQQNVRLRPLTSYRQGWSYVISVQGGAGGCTSESGVSVLPFVSHFEVP